MDSDASLATKIGDEALGANSVSRSECARQIGQLQTEVDVLERIRQEGAQPTAPAAELASATPGGDLHLHLQIELKRARINDLCELIERQIS